jgi:hypothetical protein
MDQCKRSVFRKYVRGDLWAACLLFIVSAGACDPMNDDRAPSADDQATALSVGVTSMALGAPGVPLLAARAEPRSGSPS